MSVSVITQRQSIAFNGSVAGLKMLLERIGGPGTVEVVEPDVKFKVFESIDITVNEKMLIMEWQATTVTDLYADTVLASLMQTDLVGNTIKASSSGTKTDQAHFKECLVETLQDMFGQSSVPKVIKGESLKVTIDSKEADINLDTLVSTINIYFFYTYLFIFNLFAGRKMRR